MRIIAGKHKGRRIELGKASGVRPTSEFARQAIFNILSHGRFQGALPEARVADICCGSGALGLEALSRGASHATFVDTDPHALHAAQANAKRYGEEAHCAFLRADATRLPPARAPYHLILMDPPYHSGLIAPCLKSLLSGGWLAQGGLVVAEHDSGEEIVHPDALNPIDERRYGRAVIRLLSVD